MKKKAILTILLTFISLASLAQVKSGLNLCLRDEATGDWLIGLFDEYAIYDCDYWDYAEAGKNSLVLTKDGQRKEVKLKKSSITIDGVKYKTSVLTSNFLPDYPVADETAFDGTLNDTLQDAVLRVVHRSKKAGIRIRTSFAHLVKDDQIAYEGASDSLGRYEARIPLLGQTGSMILSEASIQAFRQGNWAWIPYFFGPGEKMLLFVDDVENRIYVMGKTARMTNEFLSNPVCGFNLGYDAREQMDMPTFLRESEKGQRAVMQRRDSILAVHPLLSKRYKDYTSGMQMSFFASELEQIRFNRTKVKREEVIAEALKRNLFQLEMPYALLDRYDGFLDGLCDEAVRKHCFISSGVPFLRYILQKARDGKLQLSADEVQLIESELPVVDTLSLPSREMLDSLGIFVRGFQMTDTLSKMFSQRPELLDEVTYYNQRKEIEALDSVLNLPPLLREIAVARKMQKKLSSAVKPFSDIEMQMLRENVHHPYLLGEVLKSNDELIAARKAAESIVTPDPRPLAELTDGEALFRKITEPYKGKFIYLDVWGTWCAPCKKMMEYVPQMKEQLKDLDIVYLYLCNNSTEESWKNAIAKFHLTGDNCIHYNLPPAQESALERYIGVSGYPTYKIVMPNGNLLPTNVPRPDHPEAIRNMIEELQSEQ